MANQQEIEETYNFMDEIFRLSFGENADLTCAMYNGNFSKTLAQAQRDKHDYILDGIGFKITRPVFFNPIEKSSSTLTR
jgi:cyclopropane-fatty-acyl-phospholipid synthase